MGQRDDAEEYAGLVKSHGGKHLKSPSGFVKGYVKVWLMDLFSDRTAGFSVVGMRAKDLRCRPASAKMVVLSPSQGGGSYEGMLFDLSESAPPIITGEGEEHFGEPYFSYKKIDLGNGATPGGLRVEVTSGTKDCDWVFEVEYRDTKGVHVQEIRNGKEKFTIDGLPAHPEQLFVLSPATGRFIDCGEAKGSEEWCDVRLE
jgi:hypothetical protein